MYLLCLAVLMASNSAPFTVQAFLLTTWKRLHVLAAYRLLSLVLCPIAAIICFVSFHWSPLSSGHCLQPLRIPGTGCASQADIDYCWPAIQAAVLRDMVLRHNRRPDGRGLHDLRTNNYEVGTLQGPGLQVELPSWAESSRLGHRQL